MIMEKYNKISISKNKSSGRDAVGLPLARAGSGFSQLKSRTKVQNLCNFSSIIGVPLGGSAHPAKE